MHKGSCLCGQITFEIEGKLSPADGCHCTQCRKWTGHFLVSTDVTRSELTINGDDHITRYQSSEKARRVFCSRCGASLFFDPLDKNKHNWIGVSMGAFDTPTQSALALHIFVSEKGDYYQIDDGIPQNQR